MQRQRRNIRRRTYNNFMYIVHTLQREKGYPENEAIQITRNIFDNSAVNPGQSIWKFYDLVLTRKEYNRLYLNN